MSSRPIWVELDPDNEYDRELFDNTMPGLLELDLEQRIYLAGMITLNNGEIGLAQAKSPEDARSEEHTSELQSQR